MTRGLATALALNRILFGLGPRGAAGLVATTAKHTGPLDPSAVS
jgi:hypothetical protein